MGILDFLTGSKAAPAGLPRRSPGELREALLALNRDSSPFLVRDGAPENADLVAEWKVVDAAWYEIFAKAGISKVFKVLMALDAEKGVVRSLDQEWSVEWRAGVPELALSGEAFRGQKFELSFGTAYAFTETLAYGQVYNYRFSTQEMKGQLQDVAAKMGWGWRGVAFGKL